MDSLLGFLLIAGLFFLMMRHGHGCGAHGGHGGHGGGGHKGTADPGHRDPVCGHNVDPQEGYGRMFEGRLYRFCSRSCLDRFDEAPGRYTSEAGHAAKRIAGG